MNKKVFLFPGQGSQYQGMAKSVLNENKEKVDLVSKIMEVDIIDIFNSEKIHETKYSQICIFLHSALLIDKLEKGHQSFGLSLGDFTSLYYQGLITFEKAITLIKKRAELMSDCCNPNEFSMMALRCKDLNDLEEKLINNNDIFIANYNSLTQVVISGRKDSLIEFNEKEKMRGILLNVSGAFHSPFLKNAALEFKDFVEDFELINFLSSSSIDKLNCSFKDFVYHQMIGSVYFKQGIENLINDGYNEFIEIGPNNVLSKLVKQISKDVNVENMEEIYG